MFRWSDQQWTSVRPKLFWLLPVVAGLVVLIGSGLVHGVLTNRWLPSEQLQRGIERMAKLPNTVGTWISEPFEQDPAALEIAGALASYSRRFTDPQTGEVVIVSLLLGKAARMVVHRPEHCYQSVGYELIGAPSRFEVQPRGQPASEFFAAIFNRDEAHGPNRLRIFWSFGHAGRWTAPDNPRLAYAGAPLLYKLYVVRQIGGTSGNLRDDACFRLLGDLLPLLNSTLFSDGGDPGERN